MNVSVIPLWPLAAVPGPFAILLLSVAVIVAAIVVLRIHAFFALMIASILVGLLTAAGHTGAHRWTEAIGAATTAFGAAAGKIGLSIALAAVIGVSLMTSGAADKLVRRLIAVLGAGRAALALLVSAFVMSAPVFNDTVAMLLLPIARALSLRTRKDYLLYVLAICAGGTITNGTVPPAPGPLLVAEALKLNLGLVIVAGVIFGILPAAGALWAGHWFNARMPVAAPAGADDVLAAGRAAVERPESELPPFWAAAAPIVIPFALIAGASCLKILALPVPAGVAALVEVLGDKNIALLLGAIAALAVLARQKGLGWRQVGGTLAAPLEIGGIIILVVSAGGAYGEMIKRAGLGEAVQALAGGRALNFVLIAYGMTVIMRLAQGSATVAMITGAGIAASIAGPAGFGIHPLYILLAAGYGSKAYPWMNDAGFWVINRIGGLSEGQILRSWSVIATGVSIFGLAEVLLASHLWPQLPF